MTHHDTSGMPEHVWIDRDLVFTYLEEDRPIDSEKYIRADSADLKARRTTLNPNMPAEDIRLRLGELTSDEIRLVREAIRWANSRMGVNK